MRERVASNELRERRNVVATRNESLSNDLAGATERDDEDLSASHARPRDGDRMFSRCVVRAHDVTAVPRPEIQRITDGRHEQSGALATA